MKPQIKEEIYIQSYKHNKSLHRTWCKAFVVESDEDKVVCITDKTDVIEDDGRKWTTKEPAIYILYYHEWFNVIAMLRKTGLYYYCNIATPIVCDDEAAKNIDYDLDLKIYPDGHYQILDEEEYKYHKKKMQYSEELDKILHYALDKLIDLYKNKKAPFDEALINSYYQKYIVLKGD